MSFAEYMQKLLTSLMCIATLLMAGCSVYKLDVPQGNVVTQEMVDMLRPGMSKRQVAFLLGTPLVTDTFHQSRWDYVYSLRPGRGEPKQQHIAVFFQDDKLVRTEGNLEPRGESNAPSVAERRGSDSIPRNITEQQGTF